MYIFFLEVSDIFNVIEIALVPNISHYYRHLTQQVAKSNPVKMENLQKHRVLIQKY
jgi:hypothetical protein